jgi:histidinol-phosphate aminotransferase
MASAMKADTRLVCVVNPNNPTGTVLDPSKLKGFCTEMSKKAVVFCDEAYLEFLEPANQVSMVELVKEGRNVIVSRTFSKIYGLAGLRFGYVVAPPELIKRLARYQATILMNQAVVAAVYASIDDKDFMKYTRDHNAEARAYLCQYLDKKKWFYGKSHANVVFFPAPKDGKMLLEETEKRGFQIRVWDYLDKEWCRVSIGTLDEMKAFVKSFDQIV